MVLACWSVFLAGMVAFGVFYVQDKLLLPKSEEELFLQKNSNKECILVKKSEHKLYYWRHGQLVAGDVYNGFVHTFPVPVALGRGGACETPEGEYYICYKNPQSKFTLFLGLSYPNIADANNAVEMGSKLSVQQYASIYVANLLKARPPWSTPLGGAYGIHAAPTYMARELDRKEKVDPNLIQVTKKDNTLGCVAVENRVIKYLFAKVELGTPVLIIP